MRSRNEIRNDQNSINSENGTLRVKPPPKENWDDHFQEVYPWHEVFQFGGFPEPFFQQNHEKLKRWQRLYRERMIREDLRDLQNVRDLRIVEDLALLLQERAGSQLSYQSLREDLSTSFESIKRWIDLLEALFYCYRIKPYSKNIKNSRLKEPKIYLYDWSLVKSEGHRLENLVAGHLLKACQAWSDSAMGEFELYYVRSPRTRDILQTPRGFCDFDSEILRQLSIRGPPRLEPTIYQRRYCNFHPVCDIYCHILDEIIIFFLNCLEI